MSIKSKFFELIRELLIVFIGVFAAFLLNDYWNDQVDKREVKGTYNIICEDLQRYYDSGEIDNKEGFINLFQNLLANTERKIEKKELPQNFEIYGDYWNIELINSMLQSGKLNNIDSEIFKDVSRLHTVHGNMINTIEKFNKYSVEQILPNLDKGVDEFYDKETNELKTKYEWYLSYQKAILYLSEATVGMAENLKKRIKSKHL